MFPWTLCQLLNKEDCGSKAKNSPFQFAEGSGRQDSSGNDADIFWYFAPNHFIFFRVAAHSARPRPAAPLSQLCARTSNIAVVRAPVLTFPPNGSVAIC